MENLVIYFVLLSAIAFGWVMGRLTAGNKKVQIRETKDIFQDYFVGLNYLLNDEPDEAIDTFIKALEINSETFETHLAFTKSVERARKGKGPSVIVSDVVRLLPHSSSDDQRKYRSEEELELDRQRDPLLMFINTCIESGVAKQEEFDKISVLISSHDLSPYSLFLYMSQNEHSLNEQPIVT